MMQRFKTLALAACAAAAFGAAPFVPTTAAVTTTAIAADEVYPEDLEQGFIILVEDKARRASAASPIYLASNQNGWDPRAEAWKLSPRSDGRWQIIVKDLPIDGRMSFKLTRGGWETVEVTPEYDDIDNRLLPKVDVSKLGENERPVFNLVVPAWRDERPSEAMLREQFKYRELQVTGDVRRLEISGAGMPLLRDALVWLPPEYDKPSNHDRRYPVLYLLDGQNVFEQHPGIPAEWGADETATRLIEQGKIEPIIIVAIPHAEEQRASEYLPIQLMPGAEPHADKFVGFLTGVVKPRVDRAFRTQTGPEHTAIGGASFGGIAALYAATERPDVFGMAICESPSLTMSNNLTRRYFAQRSSWPSRVFFGYGGRENGPDAADANKAYVNEARQFGDLLTESVGRDNVRVISRDGALHNEEAWGKRFPMALEFLFGK